MHKTPIVIGMALSAIFATAKAESLAITNPGFEQDFVADGDFNSSITPSGWSIYDPSNILNSNYNDLGVLNPTGTTLYPDGAPEGSNVALVFLWPQSVPQQNQPAGIQQTLSSTLQANTQYTLTVQVGNIGTVTPAPPYDLIGFPGYQVQLLAGGVVLAMDNDTLNPPDGTFQLSTVEFTTGAAPVQLGQAISIRLVNLNIPNSGIEVNFDDVKLETTAVPEPSTLGLACAAALGLLARRRR